MFKDFIIRNLPCRSFYYIEQVLTFHFHGAVHCILRNTIR